MRDLLDIYIEMLHVPLFAGMFPSEECSRSKQIKQGGFPTSCKWGHDSTDRGCNPSYSLLRPFIGILLDLQLVRAHLQRNKSLYVCLSTHIPLCNLHKTRPVIDSLTDEQ